MRLIQNPIQRVGVIEYESRAGGTFLSDKIALIGLPGSGKSTVGKLLSERLTLPFEDLDSRIAKDDGLSIADIFATFGEDGFRERERRALIEVTSSCDMGGGIVATGGGIVVTKECRDVLLQQWFTVYLNASVQTLVHRLASERDSRPLLAGNDELLERVSRLYRERRRYYTSTAHVVVNVDHLTPGQVVDGILEARPAT